VTGASCTAVAALRGGRVVCLPTETTYGLAVDVESDVGIQALFGLKPRSAAVAAIAADVQQARSLARVWPAAAADLAHKYWPGPLTLVVPARSGLHPGLVGPQGGVGVRVSSHPVARGLAAELGRPITATSANPSGASPALSVAEARTYFGNAVSVYLDGGTMAAAAASTVLAVDEIGQITVLRPGVLSIAGVC
jgi:L-threonylcarbamoyladenylate synthase